jgi:hypothetical protein
MIVGAIISAVVMHPMIDVFAFVSTFLAIRKLSSSKQRRCAG